MSSKLVNAVAICLILTLGPTGGVRVLTPGAFSPSHSTSGGDFMPAEAVFGAPACTYTISMQGTTPKAVSASGGASLKGTPGEDVGAFVNGLLGPQETLCFDPGNYVLTTEIFVSNESNVVLWFLPGAAMSTSDPIRLLHIIGSPYTLVHGGNWTGPGAGTLPDVEVDQGSSYTTIEGAELSRAGYDGILIDHDTTPNLHVSVLNDSLRDNGRFGVQDYQSTLAGSRWTTISGNRVEDNAVGGVYANRAADVTIASNEVSNTAAGQGAIGIGVELGYNDTITQNNVSHMRSFGIQVYYNNYTTVSNNYSAFNSGTSDQSGITNDHSFYDTISGNTFVSNGRDGIHVERSSYVTVSGNIADGNGQYGIEIYHGAVPSVDHEAISGNTCSFNTAGGVILNSATDSVIVGNRCMDNSGPGILLYNDQGQIGSTRNLVSNNWSGDDRLSGRTQPYGIREENQANHNEMNSNAVCNNTVADISTVGQSTNVAWNDNCRFGLRP